MSSDATPSYEPLPAPRRIITTHNASGQAVIDTSIPQELEKTAAPGADLYLAYTAPSLPAQLADDGELVFYKSKLPHNVGIAVPGGLVTRFVDFLPGGPEAPLHRTESIDTGVLIEGELELFLDSGETQVLRRGDAIVQRGTLHGWRNKSETTVARLFVVIVSADLPTVEGKKLGEYVPMPGLEAQ
ncbi:cupin domain containing protein [Colletotrichum truncatum]|uniref:Cupin domain containing protein n=1 Tax=Colletotrichum truncatum TaxID=5467 RepID=A0ACC3YQE7_COLTU|nr:cupin domain containing protein [Colletotrichum truncatum]KAF6796597.1 cupin domain containing protein [Colletotrichum truncatum]